VSRKQPGDHQGEHQVSNESTTGDKRVLIGHFAADADPDDIVDAIIAALPPDKRPFEDRPGRKPDENGRARPTPR
jgi:hypothetical protein